MFINKVILVGNLTKKPEKKMIPSGTSVCSFSLATNRKFKTNQGEQKEEVEFHNLVAFGKVADIIEQYCEKGQKLYVEGRLHTNAYEDKQGIKRYSVNIIVMEFQFGPKALNNEKWSSNTNSEEFPQESQPIAKNEPIYSQDEVPLDDINPEDVPF